MTEHEVRHVAPDYHDRFLAEQDAGRFVIPSCMSCGNRFWHPRSHCPACGSDRIDFVEPSWPAHVYTYTVNHRPKKADRPAESAMIGYIELDDGLRLLVNLDLEASDAVIGTAVRPQPRRTDQCLTFTFVPTSDA